MRRWASFSPGSFERSLGSAAVAAGAGYCCRCSCFGRWSGGNCCGLDAAVAPRLRALPAWVKRRGSAAQKMLLSQAAGQVLPCDSSALQRSIRDACC